MVTEPLYWAFLVVAVAVVWLLPERLRAGWVALASLAWLAGRAFILEGDARQSALSGAIGVVVASAVVYLAAPLGARPGKGRVTAAVVIGLVLFLCVFKYLPALFGTLAPENAGVALVLPLGISYFTFKLIHYAVESGRGNVKDRNPATFFAWMLLAPAFLVGPIERFDHFLAHREARPSVRMFVEGLTRIVHGVVKKFLLADWLVWDAVLERRTAAQVVEQIGDLSRSDVRWFLFGTLLHIYFDFAGYTDMAIGASRLLGFGIQENFDAPLLSRNISTFWKKWHMTLAGWCQSYVYMPMIGLTRNPYAAVFATFLVMGLWHSADLNYVAWAVYQATGVSVALTWSRWRMKRGIRPATSGWRSWWGIPVTLVFFTGSVAFSATHGHGLGAACKVGARALGFRVDS